MNKITVSGFRCFDDEQTVPLAPLTLLVGENSTGKSSFLALIRALWDVAFQEKAPDFKEAPYDLGTFDEIVHFHGSKAERPSVFKAGFTINFPILYGKKSPKEQADKCYELCFDFTFHRDGAGALPTTRCIRAGNAWAKIEISTDG